MVNTINTALCYIWKSKRIKPKSSHYVENIFSYFVSIWDDGSSLNLCGKHFMMYVSQIILLYTINIYSAICQLSLNETGRKTDKQTDRTQADWCLPGVR